MKAIKEFTIHVNTKLKAVSLEDETGRTLSCEYWQNLEQKEEFKRDALLYCARYSLDNIPIRIQQKIV